MVYQYIKYSSLRYIVGLCLSMLYIKALSTIPRLPVHPSVPPCPFTATSLCPCFCFIDKCICVRFQFSHRNDIMWYLSFSSLNNLWLHPCCCKWHSFFSWLSSSLLYIYAHTTSSLPAHLSMAIQVVSMS